MQKNAYIWITYLLVGLGKRTLCSIWTEKVKVSRFILQSNLDGSKIFGTSDICLQLNNIAIGWTGEKDFVLYMDRKGQGQ